MLTSYCVKLVYLHVSFIHVIHDDSRLIYT